MDTNENAAEIMRLALLSADDYVEKDTELPANKGKTRYEYTFTKKEAVEIANHRLFGRNYTFSSPIIKRDYPYKNFITVSNENDYREKTRIAISLHCYYGNLKINNNFFKDDGALRALIARAMIKKYGTPYKMAYASFFVRKAQKAYQENGDLSVCASKLERRLAAIGKQSEKASLLVLGDYDYSALGDLPEQSSWLFDKEIF